MTTTFAWLDTSAADRRRALDAIAALRMQESRDELGIGVIRDAISDRLAPGTSTLQTRARYFLFIPWHYRELHRLRYGPKEVAAKARRDELRLTQTLQEGGEKDGVIGIQAGAALQRLPSSIYWAGLGRLGILLRRVSQTRFHSSFGKDGRRGLISSSTTPRNEDWHPHVPPVPDGFPARTSFQLSAVEAEFLVDRVRSRANGTFLHEIIDAGDSTATGECPWDHPHATSTSPVVRQSLEHARAFSELMFGAALLYNLLLSEAKEKAEWIDRYQTSLAEWSEKIEERRDELTHWDRDSFWQMVLDENPRVHLAARNFVESWAELVISSSNANFLVRNERARDLIAKRERRLKGGRSRLASRAHLDLWRGASGSRPLNYRWPVVQAHVRDILAPLAAEKSA